MSVHNNVGIGIRYTFVYFISIALHLSSHVYKTTEVYKAANKRSFLSRRRVPRRLVRPHPLKAFGVGNNLPYSATASTLAEQHWEELRNTI